MSPDNACAASWPMCRPDTATSWRAVAQSNSSRAGGRTGNFTVLVTVASTALARTPPPEPLSCLASRARRWRLVSHRSTMATGPQNAVRAARTTIVTAAFSFLEPPWIYILPRPELSTSPVFRVPFSASQSGLSARSRERGPYSRICSAEGRAWASRAGQARRSRPRMEKTNAHR